MKSLIRMIALVVVSASAGAQTIAIVDATVHTVGPAGTIENATIVIENGGIAAVGRNVDIPASADRIDASGKIVTPGLFAPQSQIGLVEVSAVAGTFDAIQRGDDYSAGFDVAEAFNARSVLIPINRVDGVTRAAISPLASEPDPMGYASRVLSGLASVVHLGDVGDRFTRRAAARRCGRG